MTGSEVINIEKFVIFASFSKLWFYWIKISFALWKVLNEIFIIF